MKPIVKSVSVSIAAAALASLAAAGCGTTNGGTPSKSAPSKSAPAGQAGFAGYRWAVTAIDHAGKETPVPGRYGVGLLFTPNGEFGASDSVNYHSGTYHQAGDGFATSSISTTAIGYPGKDPIVLLAVSAISAFDDGVHATAVLHGDRLMVTVGGYTLIGHRDGKQANFPTATPSGASSSVAG